LKILVIGHSRSGTTLLRKLLESHLQVRRILNETWLLYELRGRSVSNFMWDAFGNPIKLLFDPITSNWGEKVLFDWPELDFGIFTAYDYCVLWNEYFEDVKIFNIYRHPFDVVLSVADKRKISVEEATNIYLKTMPSMHEDINSLPNSCEIRFESLIAEPIIALKNILAFSNSGLNVDDETMTTLFSKAKAEIQYGEINKEVIKKRKADHIKIKNTKLEKIANGLGYEI